MTMAGLYISLSRRAKSGGFFGSMRMFVAMPRSLAVRLVIVAVVVIAALVALSRIDPTRSTTRVVKPVADNALAH